jgi:putative ABC transport system permease protein
MAWMLVLVCVVMLAVTAFGIVGVSRFNFGQARMPWYYLPGGALSLWLLGQASVFGPAQKAASVPPVVATRSV